MPHFRTRLDPPSIAITSAALSDDVWPSLKMARYALETAVGAQIDATNETLGLDVDRLKLACREKIRDLRASRDAALKVREDKLPADEPPVAQPGEAA